MPKKSSEDSTPESDHVPDVVKDWKFYVSAKNFKKYWPIYGILLLLIIVPFGWPYIQEWQSKTAARTALERFLTERQQEIYDRTNPPLPVRCGNEPPIFENYTGSLSADADHHVVFLVGPAGAGKSVLRRQVLKEFWHHDGEKNPVLVRLNKQPDATRKGDEFYGNAAKFYFLPQPPTQKIGTFEGWLAKVLARQIPSQNAALLENALKHKANTELRIILDDFDEIHRDSRANLLNLIYTTLSNNSLKRTSIVILSRADALIQQQGVNEILELSRESDGKIDLAVMRILPFSRSLSEEHFESYLADAREWGAQDNKRLAQDRFDALKNIPQERVNEFLAWIDSANGVFKYFASDDFRDDETAFIKAMQVDWYQRAQQTHAFPDFEESKEFLKVSGNLLSDIKRRENGVAGFDDKFRQLLFTGLVEIEPVTLDRGQFRVRPQFEALADWYIREAGRQTK